jgi:hypothetical protein
LVGLIAALTLSAISEAISVVVDIESNTRKTAEALQRDIDAIG